MIGDFEFGIQRATIVDRSVMAGGDDDGKLTGSDFSSAFDQKNWRTWPFLSSSVF